MARGSLLSDIMIYSFGFGLVFLFYGVFYTLGRRIPGPDPNDPDRYQRFMGQYARTTDKLGPPLVVGICLLAGSLILFIVSRLVR